MISVDAEAVAALWEDLLQRSSLPPRAAGVTGTEHELAQLVQSQPVRIIDAPAAETWIWSDLHLRDPGAFESSGRPFADLRAMEARTLEGVAEQRAGRPHHRLPGRCRPPGPRSRTRTWSTSSGRVRDIGSSSSATTTSACGASSRRPGSASSARPHYAVTEPAAALTTCRSPGFPSAASTSTATCTRAATRRRGASTVGVDAIGFAPRRLDRLLEELPVTGIIALGLGMVGDQRAVEAGFMVEVPPRRDRGGHRRGRHPARADVRAGGPGRDAGTQGDAGTGGVGGTAQRRSTRNVDRRPTTPAACA